MSKITKLAVAGALGAVAVSAALASDDGSRNPFTLQDPAVHARTSVPQPSFGVVLVELLNANFDDKTIDAAIGTGGAGVGEPVSVDPAITATVRSAPFATPSLEIGDNSMVTGAAAVFEFIGSQEITSGIVSISANFEFSVLDNYNIGVREQGGNSKSFTNISLVAGGNFSISDANGFAGVFGSYQAGVPLQLTIEFDMDAGTYDILLDGSLIVDDRSHGITDRGVGRVLFGTGFDADLNGIFYVDNVVVSSTSGCTAPVCGDYDGNGFIGAGDIIRTTGYLDGSFTPHPTPDCVDVDDHEGFTIIDHIQLVEFVFKAMGSLDCPPSFPQVVPQASADYLFMINPLFPANETSHTFTLDMHTLAPHSGFWLPMRIRVDGEVPMFGTLTPTTPAEAIAAVGGDQIVAISDVTMFSPTSPGLYPLGSIELIMPSPSTVDREITVEWAPFPDAVNTAMMLTSDFAAWEPNISACPVLRTGDVNLSGAITSADIIVLVGYVFKGQAEPQPCPAAGDVNFSGTVTSSDIIFVVNHAFKGAEPPVDVCPLILSGIFECP